MKKKYLKPDAEFMEFQVEEKITDGGNFDGLSGVGDDEEW